MNKYSVIAKNALVAVGMIGMAYASPAQHSLTSWTGFYAGVDAGFVFNNIELKSQQLGFTNPSGNCNTSSNFSSFFPGVQLGYMHQFANYFVSGIEANVTFNNKKDRLGCPCSDDSLVADNFSFRNKMQRSIKARVGRTQKGNKNILLPYVTAGASFADLGLTYTNEGGDYYSKTSSQAGVLLGGGIEWSFKQNWSIRAEYSYVDYGKTVKMKIPSIYGLEDLNGKALANLYTNNVMIALNYWI